MMSVLDDDKILVVWVLRGRCKGGGEEWMQCYVI